MKIKNNTDFPDSFLKKMISWICKNPHMCWSVRKIRGGVEVRNRSTGHKATGHAWPARERIVVSIGVSEMFRETVKDEKGFTVWALPEKGRRRAPLRQGPSDQMARVRALIDVMAHEIAHLTQWEKRSARGQYSETEANWKADRVLEAFAEDETGLTALWMELPRRDKEPKAKPSIREQRYERAKKNLANWERKARLAKTKLAKYRKQVQYYEKALDVDQIAAKRGIHGDEKK